MTESEQCSCGLDVPAQMDGEMTIRDLKMTYNYKQKEAEIVFWKIQLEKQYKQQKAKEKKDLLRIDETKYIPSGQR